MELTELFLSLVRLSSVFITLCFQFPREISTPHNLKPKFNTSSPPPPLAHQCGPFSAKGNGSPLLLRYKVLLLILALTTPQVLLAKCPRIHFTSQSPLVSPFTGGFSASELALDCATVPNLSGAYLSFRKTGQCVTVGSAGLTLSRSSPLHLSSCLL